MDKKEFKTLVKKNHEKFGGNEYVRGKISGISYILCGKETYPHLEDAETGDVIITHECYQEQYDIFKITIEDLYPDLCIFDYKRS